MFINWFNGLNGVRFFDIIRPHDPPRDLTPVAGGAWAWLLMAVLAGALVAGITLSVLETRRAPQLFPPPLVFMLFLTPALLNFQEAPGDWATGIWYSKDTPLVAFTMLQRPIPFWITLLWFGVVPLSTLIMYRLMATGSSVRTIVATAITLGVAEMAVETLACNTGLMSYYAYFAKVLNVPPTQFLTNGFMYVWGGAVLVWLVPRLQKSSLGAWRWLLVVPCVFAGYYTSVLFVLPIFIGAAWHEYPVVNWAATVLGLVLTVVASLALLYSPWMKRVREGAHARGHVAMDAPVTLDARL